uniref:DNA primase large subunit n=2 Tax=Attheya septentrionalis TaxID=420275 RepID=A0A7S2UM83_9STRA|mmetsp:Transcript_4362/g.7818  ORF Transcript_4362/g.7818 Transcript_4362/m.7818 type:complete len:504 (+) Transcript_4362:78-1589(+)|eukprot:CAMPEP_0198284080 /NCGR_PEP_ID=MMETSP1449-20131203/3601_1 /TAXON_ID=420275 /ORGANISM="Attheya septentrionalis, Strain CCMP2084" /LENGTH=503 /DNA_ID=CAMNT_0043980995 /DNA_START=71 /DNA_END=1582 /DNA_ORIENTATION=-
MNAVRVRSSNGEVLKNDGRFIKEETDLVYDITADANFYNEVPSAELSLDEFEEAALARLKVLRKIEELKVRNITGDSFHTMLMETLKANLLVADTTNKKKEEQSKKLDVNSHFILRAAYCHSEDLRRWFKAQETFLFKYRFENLMKDPSRTRLRQFFRESNIDLDRVSASEKERLRPMLLSCSDITPTLFPTTPYFAVPFTQALDLVAKRQCYVEAGLAYVPLPKIVSIVTNKFTTALSKSLTNAGYAFSKVTNENGRINPLLKSMHSQYADKNRYTTGEGMSDGQELTSQNVDTYAAQSMPLCMSQLHSGLQQDHKLKHWGRLQYGLFLKGAGMTMEESLMFFQREFGKIITAEQFNKNYSYNIRHMYGKEGKRASYTPYNCTKIILGNPPQSGDHHGCPYRHYDDTHLSSLLTKMNIGTPADRDAIMSHKKAQNPQLACVRHFEAVHPAATSVKGVTLDNVGNHPNAWFAGSVSYHAAKSDNVKPDPDAAFLRPVLESKSV